ncbi:ORF MSV225 hypothetical protein [Melanoplus sanguinipes entomopoxvirus]|uniref:Macro domain-containing protein n=1 Tax=Melanoplus sanguinipes entomopoxvirus TaxID=83191 RepID=Q9YVL7_MSEPV|nr:ORF MSV225 hypothetical protein [Melanoplus sanguinipes entomopoxvirus]AAC97746.1 ORF MSV225 hypothetical protein [Melanoplus sanguinipes entomopoxvirus 'O']
MNYKEIFGDVLKTNIIVHTIGADAAFGKGIAYTIKKKYFKMVKYLQSKTPLEIPGVYEYINNDNKIIINLVTKPSSYKKPTLKQYEDAIELLREYCIKNNITTLNMPAIGSGLDGLNWDDVSNIIKEKLCNSNINVNVYLIH